MKALTPRVHFHTFDALRTIAFLFVFISHIPFNDSDPLSIFHNTGGVAVTFFFVLSGFLISYLLLHEKKQSGSIDLKSFFIRRALRIWPLYYAMLLFAFMTPYLISYLGLNHSSEGYTPNWILSMLFLENYVMMFRDSFPNVSPMRVMWTLCIEEQFYIIWGLSFYFTSLKNIPKLIAIAILVSFISKYTFSRLGYTPLDVFSFLDYFAYGTIGAYLFVCHNELVEKISTIIKLRVKQLYFVLVMAAIIMLPQLQLFHNTAIFQSTIWGILFAILILLTLGQSGPFKIPDTSILGRLGKYTFGLYLFHTIFINLLLNINYFNQNLYLVMVLSLLATILSGILSYYVFEKPFLRLRNKLRNKI